MSDALPDWALKRPIAGSDVGGHPLTPDILAPYLRIESEHSIRSANEFTDQVLSYYLGEEKTGYRLPWPTLDETFRLRSGESTLLGGINSSGKSLALGQIALQCLTQGAKVLSVSLEMSPRSQLVRLNRMASTELRPTTDFCLGFALWCMDKLYFFDKEGTMNMDTLEAGIRYSIHNFDVDLILVDSLMTISGIRHDDYTAQKEVVCRLADLARDLECHIILVAHARKSLSMSDQLDRFSIRGAGELTDRPDNVLLLQRYYSKDDGDPDVAFSISKARHWDMAECQLDLWMDMASMNLLMHDQKPKKIDFDADCGDEELDG